MSKINLTLPVGETVQDGKMVTFRAPDNCSAVEALIINNVEYTLVDSLGNPLGTNESVFSKNCLVSVILDVTYSKASVLNSGYVARAGGLRGCPNKAIHNITIWGKVGDSVSIAKKGSWCFVAFSIISTQLNACAYDSKIGLLQIIRGHFNQPTGTSFTIPASGSVLNEDYRMPVFGLRIERNQSTSEITLYAMSQENSTLTQQACEIEFSLYTTSSGSGGITDDVTGLYT